MNDYDIDELLGILERYQDGDLGLGETKDLLDEWIEDAHE